MPRARRKLRLLRRMAKLSGPSVRRESRSLCIKKLVRSRFVPDMAQRLKCIKKCLNCLAGLNVAMQTSHEHLSAATCNAFAREIINCAQRDALFRILTSANKAKHVGLGGSGWQRVAAFRLTGDSPPLLPGVEFDYTYGSYTYAVKIFEDGNSGAQTNTGTQTCRQLVRRRP